MKDLYLFSSLLLTSICCYANDAVPFPKFAKGAWSLSTSAVQAKGDSFRTDDRVSACWDPVVTMRGDIDKIINNKCEVNVTSATEHEVNFTISCPNRTFDVKRYIKLSFPDEYHFHQHESSLFAKTDLWGTYVGPCPSE